jgi:hypothetical protein
MKEKISQKELNFTFSHLHRETVRNWIRWGLAETIQEGQDKRGIIRSFSLDAVAQLRLTEILSGLGFRLDTINLLLQGHGGFKGNWEDNLFIGFEFSTVSGRQGISQDIERFWKVGKEMPTEIADKDATAIISLSRCMEWAKERVAFLSVRTPV